MNEHEAMLRAFVLAEAQLGRVWPNPAVGCVLLKDGRVLGEGATQPGGRPHAEVEALSKASNPRGATAVVSLEPCSHHGETPPCADALLQAGVRRVVVALLDPDPRVNGRGLRRIEAQGVEVQQRVLEAEAKLLNVGFLSKVGRGRPWFALSRASDESAFQLAAERFDAMLVPPEAPVRVRDEYQVRLDGAHLGEADEDLSGFVERLGKMGLTRVLVWDRSPLATRLNQGGFIDRTLD